MLKLIVHADDFGLSKNINDGIKESYLKGIVTAASIMANGEAFDEAIAISQDLKDLDIGVHLTLVEGKPLLKPNQVSSLVGPNGRFYPHAGQFFRRYLTKKINFDEVHRELKAQITKVKEYGIAASHLDSHQHLHMLPKILTVVIDLAREFEIPFIRLPYERLSLKMFWQIKDISRLAQLMALNFYSLRGQKRIPHRSDHFVGFFWGGRLDKGKLKNVVSQLPSYGVCELMCHPGLNEPDTRCDRVGYYREDELRALCDTEIKEFIQEKGITLTSFRSLIPKEAQLLDLSIVIPAFNEERKIAKDIRAAEEFLMSHGLRGEIIVVDDGSLDKTTEVVKNTLVSPKICKRAIRYPQNRGKGYAVRQGFLESNGEIVLFTDSGLCFGYEHVGQGLKMISSGQCEIAHGSRWLPESRVVAPQPFLRRIASRIFRWIVFHYMHIPHQFTDTQCGLKLFRKGIARELFQGSVINGYAFDIEIMLKALQRGYRIKEFPVECHHDHDSRLPTWSASWHILLELLAIKKALRQRPLGLKSKR